MLPAHKIPPHCLCTWAATCNDDEMRLKFTHDRCPHNDGSVSWGWLAWSRTRREIQPVDEIEHGIERSGIALPAWTEIKPRSC